MDRTHFLSVSDIEKEMNTGKATVKFLLKRFSQWLPHSIENGRPVYDPSVIPALLCIQEKLESGHLPSNIEADFETGRLSTKIRITDVMNSSDDIRMSKDSLSLIKSLFADINIQQERIAIAHEKRAHAEERKAAAIEKRAEAEEKKAEAMNNIARALQEMNQSRNEFNVRQLARESVSAIVTDEISDEGLEKAFSNSRVLEYRDTDIDEENEDNDLDDLGGLTSLIDDGPEDSRDESSAWIETGDLPELTDELPDPPDDLSFLIETVQEEDPVDDLSLLIDTVSEPLDDLSLLLEESVEPLDDLSLLITTPEEPLDDLSLLIEETPEPMDDLSLLIDGNTEPMDNLSLLIDHPLQDEAVPSPDMQPPFIKPELTPGDDPAKYKSAIMNIIIQLKADGFSVEQVTDMFNQQSVRTLTGKEKWGTKAIAQIYKFIDAAPAS